MSVAERATALGTPAAPPGGWPGGSLRWAVLCAGAIAAAFLVVGLFATWQLLGQADWSAVRPGWLPLMLGLGAGSYGLRFLRWHVLTRRVAPGLRLLPSLRIYLAGFAMGLTPGRVGEFCKFTLLRQETGVPEAYSAPIFPLERATEGASFAALALAGALLGRFEPGRLGPGAIGAILAIPLLALLGLALRRVAFGARSGRPLLRYVLEGVRAVTSPGAVCLALLCAAAARCCDALMFWLAAGLAGLTLPPAGAALAWGLAGLAGGLFLLPAGVGAVEGSLVATVAALGGDAGAALLAAVLARCLSLWIWIPPGLWFAFRGAARRTTAPPA